MALGISASFSSKVRSKQTVCGERWQVGELTLTRSTRAYVPGAGGTAVDGPDDNLVIEAMDYMQTLGGSYNDHARFIRAAGRELYREAETGNNLTGLRLVRTIRLSE